MRKVLRLIDEYETIQTDHFIIRVDGREDRILGKMMAEFLEEQYPLLTEEYGFEPPQRTQFEVFHRAKGLSGHEWFSARMVGLPWVQTIGASTGMIVALTSPNDGDRPFHWARVVRHEFVHILTLQQTDFNIPHWYTEALAVSSEQAPRPVLWDRLLAQRVPADPLWITAAAESGALPAGLFSLDTINHGFVRPPTPNDWQMAYCQSFLYSEYMKERFGPDACKKLLYAYREQPTTSTALRTAFDVDQKEFEAGYRQFLQKFADSVRTEQFVPVLSAAELEKRVRADPQVASYAAEFAYVLLQQKQTEQAAQQAKAALELDPKEPLAAVVLARLALLEKDEDKAVSILQTGLDVKRPHPRLIQDLAELLIKADEAEAAAGLCDLGLKRAPRDAGLVQALIAACLKTGNRDRLKSALELRMTLDGDDPSVPRLLAQLELDAGNAEAAVRYAKESLYIDVLDPQSHRLLGLAYAAARQPDRAIDEFQTAVELEPRDASLRLNLARLQLAAGMKTRARETLQGLLQLEPDHDEAKRLLESLDR
jgi:Flp pilus assembly protein TadD